MSDAPRVHLAAALLIAFGLVILATSSRVPRPTPALRAGYVNAGGLQLRYARNGRGSPTIVLLHGYGESLVAWRGVFTRLAEHADVVALDLPGFGLSDKPAHGYTNDSLATRILAALDQLGIPRAVIVGHSLGGAVACAVAAAAPERVTALVLVDPAVVGSPAAVPDRVAEERPSHLRSAIAEYEAMRTRFTSPHDPHWLAEAPAAQAYIPADDSTYRTALSAVLAEFDFAWLTPARAARLTMPTLLLWGEYDPVFPLSEGRALAAALPRSRLEVISRAWHRPHEERPDEVAAAIARFLAPTESGKTPQTP